MTQPNRDTVIFFLFLGYLVKPRVYSIALCQLSLFNVVLFLHTSIGELVRERSKRGGYDQFLSLRFQPEFASRVLNELGRVS